MVFSDFWISMLFFHTPATLIFCVSLFRLTESLCSYSGHDQTQVHVFIDFYIVLQFTCTFLTFSVFVITVFSCCCFIMFIFRPILFETFPYWIIMVCLSSYIRTIRTEAASNLRWLSLFPLLFISTFVRFSHLNRFSMTSANSSCDNVPLSGSSFSWHGFRLQVLFYL